MVKNPTKPYFPIFIDLSEKKVVVIGGGRIATRRIKSITPFAGEVVVISEHVSDEVLQMAEAGEIRWIRERYTRERIMDADLVLACTDDPKVNDDAHAACKCLGIMVNTCSDGMKCDFYFPGIVRQDNLVVGVTASGTDHHRAKVVRQKIQSVLEGEQTEE